jgi:branched-chain amino acid transport system substrate-binding protein
MRIGTGVQLGAVALASVLLLVGCGSSGSSSPSSSGPAKSGSAASEIVIGNIGTYSGTLGGPEVQIPKILNGWVSEVNSAGGINGHHIKLIIEDDTGNAATALTEARELIQQDHVAAIVSNFSVDDGAWAALAESAGVPVIGGSSVTAAMETNPDFFPTGTTLVALAYGVMATAKKHGKNFALMYCAEAPACAATNTLYQFFAPGLGLKALGLSVSSTAPNYTAPCQAVIDSHAESVQYADAASIALRMADDCAQQGIKAQIIESGGIPDSTWLPDANVAGELTIDPDIPISVTSTPAMQAYHALLAKYGITLDDTQGQTAYIGALLFQKAVEAVTSPTVTAADIKTALYSLSGETLGGLTPPLTYVKGKSTSVDCWFTNSIMDGKFTTPDGVGVTCGPAAPILAAKTKFNS